VTFSKSKSKSFNFKFLCLQDHIQKSVLRKHITIYEKRTSSLERISKNRNKTYVRCVFFNQIKFLQIFQMQTLKCSIRQPHFINNNDTQSKRK